MGGQVKLDMGNVGQLVGGDEQSMIAGPSTAKASPIAPCNSSGCLALNPRLVTIDQSPDPSSGSDARKAVNCQHMVRSMRIFGPNHPLPGKVEPQIANPT